MELTAETKQKFKDAYVANNLTTLQEILTTVEHKDFEDLLAIDIGRGDQKITIDEDIENPQENPAGQYLLEHYNVQIYLDKIVAFNNDPSLENSAKAAKALEALETIAKTSEFKANPAAYLGTDKTRLEALQGVYKAQNPGKSYARDTAANYKAVRQNPLYIAKTTGTINYYDSSNAVGSAIEKTQALVTSRSRAELAQPSKPARIQIDNLSDEVLIYLLYNQYAGSNGKITENQQSLIADVGDNSKSLSDIDGFRSTLIQELKDQFKQNSISVGSKNLAEQALSQNALVKAFIGRKKALEAAAITGIKTAKAGAINLADSTVSQSSEVTSNLSEKPPVQETVVSSPTLSAEQLPTAYLVHAVERALHSSLSEANAENIDPVKLREAALKGFNLLIKEKTIAVPTIAQMNKFNKFLDTDPTPRLQKVNAAELAYQREPIAIADLSTAQLMEAVYKRAGQSAGQLIDARMNDIINNGDASDVEHFRADLLDGYKKFYNDIPLSRGDVNLIQQDIDYDQFLVAFDQKVKALTAPAVDAPTVDVKTLPMAVLLIAINQKKANTNDTILLTSMMDGVIDNPSDSKLLETTKATLVEIAENAGLKAISQKELAAFQSTINSLDPDQPLARFNAMDQISAPTIDVNPIVSLADRARHAFDFESVDSKRRKEEVAGAKREFIEAAKTGNLNKLALLDSKYPIELDMTNHRALVTRNSDFMEELLTTEGVDPETKKFLYKMALRSAIEAGTPDLDVAYTENYIKKMIELTPEVDRAKYAPLQDKLPSVDGGVVTLEDKDPVQLAALTHPTFLKRMLREYNTTQVSIENGQDLTKAISVNSVDAQGKTVIMNLAIAASLNESDKEVCSDLAVRAGLIIAERGAMPETAAGTQKLTEILAKLPKENIFSIYLNTKMNPNYGEKKNTLEVDKIDRKVKVQIKLEQQEDTLGHRGALWASRAASLYTAPLSYFDPDRAQAINQYYQEMGRDAAIRGGKLGMGNDGLGATLGTLAAGGTAFGIGFAMGLRDLGNAGAALGVGIVGGGIAAVGVGVYNTGVAIGAGAVSLWNNGGEIASKKLSIAKENISWAVARAGLLFSNIGQDISRKTTRAKEDIKGLQASREFGRLADSMKVDSDTINDKFTNIGKKLLIAENRTAFAEATAQFNAGQKELVELSKALKKAGPLTEVQLKAHKEAFERATTSMVAADTKIFRALTAEGTRPELANDLAALEKLTVSLNGKIDRLEAMATGVNQVATQRDIDNKDRQSARDIRADNLWDESKDRADQYRDLSTARKTVADDLAALVAEGGITPKSYTRNDRIGTLSLDQKALEAKTFANNVEIGELREKTEALHQEVRVQKALHGAPDSKKTAQARQDAVDRSKQDKSTSKPVLHDSMANAAKEAAKQGLVNTSFDVEAGNITPGNIPKELKGGFKGRLNKKGGYSK